MIGAIRFITNDNCKVFLYPVGTHGYIDWNAEHVSCLGNDFVTYEAKPGYDQPNAITIAKSLDDEYVLRLVETKRYMLRLERNDGETISLPHFQNQENKFLKCDKDKDSLSFQFINYLGRSKLYFGNSDDSVVLSFEVVPDKMDYEDDYIVLTEALAEFCSNLLLEYTGATSNVYSQSVDEQTTLLEQFIFLRQFCYAQNLQMLFEAVKRNPDRFLKQTEEYKPLGMGRPSKKFYTNPFSYSRNWARLQNSVTGQVKYMPQEVAVARKYDSLDTPANRFIKFALQKFYAVCTALTEKLDKDSQSKQAECYNEAKAIHSQLDNIFRDSFFVDIGDLDIMPQNNQVLQKREGYSQIFSACAMIDLALQLDWKGKDEAYEGESKNVALLYEYWLFFELFKIIKSIDGCEMVKTEETSFLTVNDGLTISLEQGKESCQSFAIKKLGVKINLYYNRTFKWKDFKTTKYEGSYSRPFRPDYTLAIYPDTYNKFGFNGEAEAVKCGAVSYVHFDAKYRITDLTALIGKKADDSDVEEELAEDKSGSVVNTYKRGDLLKMHTYNDAIRRTVGSYVLYPGSYDPSQKDKNRFELYDEILPGVGAFAIKPSIATQGENELKTFLLKLIESRAAHNTRLYRMNHYTETVIKEPKITTINEEPKKTCFANTLSVKGNNELVDIQNDKLCAIGYIRAGNENDYYHFLKEKGLFKNGSEFLFYFYAIKDKQVYSHHKDIFNTSYFRFYKNRISDNDTYVLEPVLCSVISDENELVSKADLVKKLKNETGYETEEKNHHADFYYVLKVKVINDNYKTDEFKTSFINTKNGNDTFSPHTPKVMLMSDLAGSDQQ